MESGTARLVLRPPRLSEAPDLFAVLGDAEAMRLTQASASLRDCRRRIAAHERRRRHDGCAPWTLRERASGRIVGWGGLYRDPFDPGWGVEVGYFLHPSVQGRGLATELVAACIALARGVLRLPDLLAFAHPENAASRRVLRKSGFAEERFLPAMNRILYRRNLGSAVIPAGVPTPERMEC